MKRAAVTENMMKHKGRARVFDGEEPALNAIYAGEIQAGDVVVNKNTRVQKADRVCVKC